jgi:hypothetical protein
MIGTRFGEQILQEYLPIIQFIIYYLNLLYVKMNDNIGNVLIYQHHLFIQFFHRLLVFIC